MVYRDISDTELGEVSLGSRARPTKCRMTDEYELSYKSRVK